MESYSEIIEYMMHAIPVHRESLSESEIGCLRELTSDLIVAKPDAVNEYDRFLGIGERSLCLPEEQLRSRLDGATVMVTGGTGCIGSKLMLQLARRGVRRLVSVSRGESIGWPQYTCDAEYWNGDVRDLARIDEIIRIVRPDVIFHCAAQRSPALAEIEVHRTVTTNVLGTGNVLKAAAIANVPQVVIASTGKALRPYSPEIYTASKRAAEWIATQVAANSGTMVSGARFTHVLDNSIVHASMLQSKSAIRLHNPNIAFYVQSALESAQLLLLAYLNAGPEEFRLNAMTNLGWPVNLIDVALGVISSGKSRTPIYISGYDPGYEEVPFPGLYDPATAGDVSPLLNAFEAAAITNSPCPQVNTFRLQMDSSSGMSEEWVSILEKACSRTTDADLARLFLDDLGWSLLDDTLAAADPTAIVRSAKIAGAHGESMSPVHQRITEAIRSHIR